MLLAFLATVTQTFHTFHQTADDENYLASALDVQLVDGDLQPLRRVFTYSQLTPDGSKLVQVLGSVINVYSVDVSGNIGASALHSDDTELQGQSVLSAALSDRYLALYLNSSTEILISVFPLDDLTDVRRYSRPFMSISVSTTQFNTTRCGGALSVTEHGSGFIVLLGCPEAETLTISVTGNQTSIATSATGAVLALTQSTTTIYAVFPANGSEATRAGAYAQNVDSSVFASANGAFLLKFDVSILTGITPDKRFQQELEISAGVNVAVRYLHVIPVGAAKMLLASAESTQVSGFVIAPSTGRLAAVVDPKIRSFQAIKRTKHDAAANKSQFGAVFSSKDQVTFLTLDKLAEPITLTGTDLTVEYAITHEHFGDYQHIIQLSAFSASLYQSLGLKDQLSLKYDLLRDSSYRDMDFGMFGTQFIAFALSSLYAQDKRIVRFVNLTTSYVQPTASALYIEYYQTDGTYTPMSTSVTVGTLLQLKLQTTHSGACADFQFSLQGTPALLQSYSASAVSGECVFTGNAPLKAGNFEISVSSFGSAVAVANVAFEALATAPKAVSLVSVKPMIIRVNQNFSIRVQMVDLYGNELSASQSVCSALVGRLYLATQRFSNNPYIQEAKSYDDLTGQQIELNGADHFTFSLVNDRYCVFNMTEGYPVSRILFVRLFEGASSTTAIELAPDVREGLMIPICDYPVSRYAIDALGAVKIILALLVVALTLFVIPFLAYRCVNPRVPELVSPHAGEPRNEVAPQQLQVASAAASECQIPAQSTSNLLPSNTISEKRIQGLGEVRLRGEPVSNQYVKEVDFARVQLTGEQLAMLNNFEPVLQVGACWSGRIALSATRTVQWRNYFFFGAESVFVAVFDAAEHAESYRAYLVLQSRLRISQLALIGASVVRGGEQDGSALEQAVRGLGAATLVCVYAQASDGMSFGNAEQCENVRAQLQKMAQMRPRRALGNVKNAVFRNADGNVLIGPGTWLGPDYLTDGCAEDVCAADMRELDELTCVY